MSTLPLRQAEQLPSLRKTKPVLYKYSLKSSFYLLCREINRIYGRTHSRFHDRIICALVEALWMVLLLFRGAAKTLYGCYYLIWVAWTTENSYCVYLSGNESQVKDGMRKMGRICKKLTFLFEDIDHIIKFEIEFKNGSLILGKTYGSNIRGMGNEVRRPNVVLGDDVIPDVMTRTHEQIINIWRRSIEFAMEPDTQLICEGTPFTPDDLYSVLEADSRYLFLRIPIWDEDETPAWIERYPHHKIKAMQEGTDAMTFAQQCLCLPMHPGGVEFKVEWIPPWQDSDISVDRNLYRYVFCDLAISESKTADYAGISDWFHRGDQWYLIDAWAIKGMDAVGKKLVALEANPVLGKKVDITMVESPGAMKYVVIKDDNMCKLTTLIRKDSVQGKKVERIRTTEPKWLSGRFHAKKDKSGTPKNAPFFWREYTAFNTKNPPKDLHILDGCQMGFVSYDDVDGGSGNEVYSG